MLAEDMPFLKVGPAGSKVRRTLIDSPHQPLKSINHTQRAGPRESERRALQQMSARW